MRNFTRVLLALFFIAPILVWIGAIDRWSPVGSEWVWPLAVSVGQALMSAAGAVVVGAVMTIGALSLRPAGLRGLEAWFLLPNLIPPLFVVLAMMNWLYGQGRPPLGLPIVILTHVLLNAGLVALSLIRLLEVRLGRQLDLARLEGASRTMIWWEVIRPGLRSELLFLFLFVFSVCLTSFAIPLILGGGSVANFEILIYETLRVNGDWSRAVFYAVIQMSVLFTLAAVVPKPNWDLTHGSSDRRSLGSIALLPIALLPTAILVLGWGIGFVEAFLHSAGLPWPPDLLLKAVNTLLVSFGVGFFILLLSLAVAYVLPHRGFAYFLKGYLAPSSAIIGFAFLLIPGEGETAVLFKLIAALTLVSFPLLFRWIGQAAIESLERQVWVARSLGASWGTIALEIVWPQRAGQFLRMAGLGALWASGDFALSSIIAEGDRTWALTVADLLSNYRLDLATLLTVPLFLLGLCCYGFFVGVGRYVTR